MSSTCRSCHSGLNVAKWLLFEHVEHRAAQPSVPQAYDERLVVQQRAARDVHRRSPSAAVDPNAYRPVSLRYSTSSGAASNDYVVARQLLVQRLQRHNALEPRRRTELRPPPDPGAAGAKRGQSLSDGLSDPAGSDDQRPHGVHLAQHRVEAHERRLVPLGAVLLVHRVVEAPQKMEDAGHHVLGHRYGVDARGVRECHIAGEHLGIERGADAGRRGVHPAEIPAPRRGARGESRSRSRPRPRGRRRAPRRSDAAGRRRRSSSPLRRCERSTRAASRRQSDVAPSGVSAQFFDVAARSTTSSRVVTR